MESYVPVVAPQSRRDIERCATRVIRRFYPKLLREPGPFPVLDFFDHVIREEYGLDSGVEALSDGVEGMTWPDGRVLVSEDTYSGAAADLCRPRFTVVHECFHGMKHRAQIRRVLVDTGELVLYRRHDIKPFLDPEWQANMFAGAVLMPETMVRRLADEGHRLLLPSVMTSVFDVSLQAAEVRLKKLEI